MFAVAYSAAVFAPRLARFACISLGDLIVCFAVLILMLFRLIAVCVALCLADYKYILLKVTCFVTIQGSTVYQPRGRKRYPHCASTLGLDFNNARLTSPSGPNLSFAGPTNRLRGESCTYNNRWTRWTG